MMQAAITTYIVFGVVTCISVGVLAANDYGKCDWSDYITAAMLGFVAGAVWPLTAGLAAIAFIISVVRKKVCPCK